MIEPYQRSWLISDRSTPDKVYYSKLRAAFATPGTTAHPTAIGSFSRANDSDLPFVLMMQQQENNQIIST